MKNIIFLGAPGSGKGTQSGFITKDFGVVQISTGDILRQAVKDGTELGKTAKEYMDDGKLVSDDLIVGIIGERLRAEDATRGFILDGFPRTAVQVEALDNMLKNELSASITHVISLQVPDALIYERITGRRSCPKCGKVYHVKFNPPKTHDLCDSDATTLILRNDDSEATLTKRLKVFHESTALIKPMYEAREKVLTIDGTRPPNEVYTDIKKFLNS